MNNCDKSESTTYWCKIYKLKKYINENNYKYVMWADFDQNTNDLGSLNVAPNNNIRYI